MKKPSNNKMKSQELRSLANSLLIQIEEKDKRIAENEHHIEEQNQYIAEMTKHIAELEYLLNIGGDV